MTEYDMVIVAIFAGIWLVCGLAGIVIVALAARKSRAREVLWFAVRYRARRWWTGLGGGFRS